MPVQAHGARQRARSQCVHMQKVVGAKRPGARQGTRSSSGSVYKVDGTVHFGARQRARSRDMSVYKIVGSMHSSVVCIPRIVFGVNPQHSVILMCI